MSTYDSRTEGKRFEELYERQCRLHGLFVRKNDHACKIGWRGRPQLVKGLLDFLVVEPEGRVGFFDAKSYEGSSVIFSDLAGHQLEQAERFNELNVPAGFVVWFRESNRVCFFSGAIVRGMGPGSRLSGEGIHLGGWESFDPSLPFRV